MRSGISMRTLLYQLLYCTVSAQIESHVREIYAFEDGTYIENLAVRPNGHLVFTTFNQGSMYSIDPNQTDAKPQVIALLPNVNAVTGIVEIAPDTFAVTASKYIDGPGFHIEPGSNKLFHVTLSMVHDSGRPEEKLARVEDVANITKAKYTNGLCALPFYRYGLLTADSLNGRILFIDAATGRHHIAIDDGLLRPSRNKKKIPIGVNAIQIHGSHLYFTNSARGIFGRIAIKSDGSPIGAAEAIARKTNYTGGLDFWDDFKVKSAPGVGTFAFVATHPNKLTRIGVFDGQQSIILGKENPYLLYNPTSVVYNRESTKLYMSTGGGNSGTGGQLLEIATP